MGRRLIRIEHKLDSVVEHIGDINVTLASQAVSLDKHIKRTDLLEVSVETLKEHTAMLRGALQLMGILALVAGLFLTLANLYKVVK